MYMKSGYELRFRAYFFFARSRKSDCFFSYFCKFVPLDN